MPPVSSGPRPVAVRLRELRVRAGLSRSALSLALGYAAVSGLQRYEDELRYTSDTLPMEMVRKLVPLLEHQGNPAITADEVWALAGVVSGNSGAARLDDQPATFITALIAPPAIARPHAVPCYGWAVSEEGTGALLLPDRADDLRDCPPSLLDVPEAYMLTVSNSAMAPRYIEGVILHVNPRQMPKPGRAVVLRLTGGRALIGEYVRGFTVRQLNPAREIRVVAMDVVGLHMVVGVDESGL